MVLACSFSRDHMETHGNARILGEGQDIMSHWPEISRIRWQNQNFIFHFFKPKISLNYFQRSHLQVSPFFSFLGVSDKYFLGVRMYAFFRPIKNGNCAWRVQGQTEFRSNLEQKNTSKVLSLITFFFLKVSSLARWKRCVNNETCSEYFGASMEWHGSKASYLPTFQFL